ncbi:MAG: hypothetical protein FWB71_00160 [Defluviitaleaceae bacterium]|nr:hypothetical protein [Defluviitaleaceae bacterium]
MENTMPAVLDRLEPELAQIAQEFLAKIKGKSIKDAIPLIAEYKARLPKDREFSPAERDAMIEAALSEMPHDERNRFKTFFKMFKLG